MIGEPFVFNVVDERLQKQIYNAALIVEIVDGQVVITLDKDKAYRVLAKKDIIVAGINKKLSELIQRKLETLAMEEEEKERGK